MVPRVAFLLVLILPALASATSLRSGLPDGKPCAMTAAGDPVKPFCIDPRKCLINKVPAPNSKWAYSGNLNGTCNSKLYTSQGPPYCMYRSIYFAVGTKNMLDKSTCEKCTCTLHPERPKGQQASCDCQKGSDCYVDRNGVSVKPLCPSPIVSQCLLTKLNVNLNGKTVDKGNCYFGSAPGQCTAAGSKFTAKFYANGTVGIPQDNNRCQACTCLNAKKVNCRPLVGCAVP